MPRRRKPAEGPGSRGQDGEEEEGEKRGPAKAKKKRSFVDAFIVISDSDGEVSGQPAEPGACAGLCWSGRVPEHPTLGSGLVWVCCAVPSLPCEGNQILFD